MNIKKIKDIMLSILILFSLISGEINLLLSTILIILLDIYNEIEKK